MVSDSETLEQHLSLAQTQLHDYQSRLGQPFTHESYLAELTSLRDQLKSQLSANTSSPENAGPTSAELTASIRQLKSAHTIEPSPPRTTLKLSTSEEPITTRIRRKAARNFDDRRSAEQSPSLVASESCLFDTDVTPQPLPVTFQERTLTQRNRPDNAQTPA